MWNLNYISLALAAMALLFASFVWRAKEQQQQPSPTIDLPAFSAFFSVRDRADGLVAVKMCDQVNPHWTGVTAYIAVVPKADALYPIVCGRED